MATDFDNDPGLATANTCTGKMEIPTPREQKALAAMRSAKDRVREIKFRLNELKVQKVGDRGDEIASLKTELTRLREKWHVLETERDAAARERMILLGHETEEAPAKS